MRTFARTPTGLTRLGARLAALLFSLWFASAVLAQATARNFDHVKTGFALTGTHASQRCESCHLGGVFKGTPRDCASCHVAGSLQARANVVKPAKHVPTQQACDSCHGTQSFVGARFSHAGVTVGSCLSCHAVGLAPGKPAGHLVTQASCDTCHRTTAWRPASRFSHVGVVAGTCAGCHGVSATGKSASHIPTTVPTSMPSCDSCHKNGFTNWLPARLHNSVSVSAQCATCHTGAFPPAVGKPATPVHAGVTVCESCHKSTTTWAGAKVDHTPFNAATNCAGCHNGSGATGRPPTHVPVGATNCLSCHTKTAWRPTSWNHTQVSVIGQCSTCHSGAFPPADGRHAAHVPYQALTGVAITNCDSCHKAGYAAWAPARVHSSVTIVAQCASCHTGGFAPAVGKPATPVHAGVTVCETCHKSTTTWAGARVDHSTFTAATNCAGCHNGSAATGKAANHIPVGATNCFACHGTTTWRPSKWNHTQVSVAGQCSTCHTGSFPPADGRPATHIPYAALTGVAITNCDTCHAGTTVWTGARLHSRLALSNQCASCHTGNFSPGSRKPNNATHAAVTTCEGCHRSTASWTSGVTFAHSAANAVGTGTCDTCHGVTATGKPANHIPVPAGTAKCDSCHRSQASFATAVTMNHAVVTTAQCKTCHNGSYLTQGVRGALAKPANHIPESQLLNGAAMDCKDCHTGTTSWTTVRMNHNSSLGGGAGWCKSCHATGTAFLGTMEKKALTHERKTPLQIDCSESGCHRPLGRRGTPYTSW